MLKIETKNPMTHQYQVEYTVYKELVDFFENAVCKSGRIAERMFLYYQDLTEKKKKDMEKGVKNFVGELLQKELDNPLPGQKNVIIRFIPTTRGNIFYLKGSCFDNAFFIYRKGGSLKYMIIEDISKAEADIDLLISEETDAEENKEKVVKKRKRIRVYFADGRNASGKKSKRGN